MSDTVTDEEYAQAMATIQARQEQEETARQAELEALKEPVYNLVNSPEYAAVVVESKRILDEYQDSTMYYGIHLNALVSGATNLKNIAPNSLETTE